MRMLTAPQPIEPMMDGVGYPKVNIKDIPRAYVTVDIALENNGDRYDAMMVAGLAICRISSSGDTSLSASGTNDTVNPGASWWLFNKISKEEIERRAEERQKRWDAHIVLHPYMGYTRENIRPGFE